MSGSPRNAGIDLMRGLSIILVIVHHVAIRIPLRKTLLATVVPARLLNALSSNGYEAVFVFFVISGFLITRNALDRSALRHCRERPDQSSSPRDRGTQGTGADTEGLGVRLAAGLHEVSKEAIRLAFEAPQ